MSIREKVRKKQEELKEDSAPSIVEEKIEEKTSTEGTKTKPEKVEKKESKTENQEIKELSFEDTLPAWVNKPWMFVTPKKEAQKDSWVDSWKLVILDFSKFYTQHIINIYEVRKKHPFTHKDTKRSLKDDQLVFIIDKMQEEGLAKWLSSKKIRARIYYKTIEQWAEEIYNDLFESGKLVEVLTLQEFKLMNKEWSNLPDADFQEIFKLFVEAKKAKYVTKERDTIQFIF